MRWWRQNGWMLVYPAVALVLTAVVFVLAYFLLLAIS